jgi:hypothetical protein
MKKRLRWGTHVMSIGIVFSILETIVYLIIYGWHKEPITDWELACDGIAGLLEIIGLCLIVYVALECIDIIIEIHELGGVKYFKLFKDFVDKIVIEELQKKKAEEAILQEPVQAEQTL